MSVLSPYVAALVESKGKVAGGLATLLAGEDRETKINHQLAS